MVLAITYGRYLDVHADYNREHHMVEMYEYRSSELACTWPKLVLCVLVIVAGKMAGMRVCSVGHVVLAV